jgi:Ankyrin repeats (3 copies)
MPFADLVRDGKLDAVRAAIEAGAQLDAADAWGLTPLMIACREGHEGVARLLMERGARLDVVGPHGETALGLAMVHCRRIAETLVDHGVLGRPLLTPTAGTLLSPSDCDVCIRYPEVIELDDRWSTTPADLAWLEVVQEKSWSEGKTDHVERSLRCPFCGTHYEQRFSHEVETVGVTLPEVTQSVRRRGPSGFPSALLGALFVAEDGKLACRIERGGDGERAPFLTTVWAGVGGVALLRRDHTGWRPATVPRSEHAGERIGQLQVELGVVGAGDLYQLYVARPNPDASTFGDKEWIAALPDTPLAELRLFPEHCGSPYTADDWDWQSGWWYPYSTFRPATPAEEAAHERAAAGKP